MPDVLSSVVDVVSSAGADVVSLVPASVELDVLDCELDVVPSVDVDEDELVPWSASMLLLPGFARSQAVSSSRDTLPSLFESMAWKFVAIEGAAAWTSASVSCPSASTSAAVQWAVEDSARSLLFASPDVCAVADVSLLGAGAGAGVIVESVEVEEDEVVEVVDWSASMLPVLLVPVAVSASGAVEVASGRLVSV